MYQSTLLKYLFFIFLTSTVLAIGNTQISHPLKLPTTLTTPLTSTFGTQTPEYLVIKSSEPITYSSETAASIAQVNVKEGSRFRIHDVLIQFDCRIQRADLKKAKAEAEAATLAEKSAEKLKSYGSISELEFVKAKAQAEIARAEVDKLTAMVDKCVIKAPFNGAVADIMIHPLETVKPGDPLLKIVNLDALEVVIQIPSQWLRWVRIGTRFYVNINEVNKKVSAIVTRIDPEIESVSQTVKITGKIEPNNLSLLPGMSGQAIFPDSLNNTQNALGSST